MSSTGFKSENDKLVDKILEQGQKLRNAMVQSILKNDPLNQEIINNKHYNTPICSTTSLADKKTSDTNLLEAFLKGDYLTKDEEETALNTIRSMSVSDVCKTTERTILSKCSCATCNAYNLNNLKCDLRRTHNYPKKCISNYIKEKNRDFIDIIKFADSLKVILQSIHLNHLGNKKVIQGVQNKPSGLGLNETYFVEYCIPEIFTKELPKSKSKIDIGLESNHVRVCARRTSEVIYMRQIFVHNICNLYDCNLEDHHITFFVKYKSRGQKTSELLGVAKFNLGLFEISKNFSCNKTLPIYLNEDSPIIIGTFKVTLQLGCGKIYFGQEFVDAVLNQKVTTDETDSSEDFKEFETNFKSNIIKEELAPDKKHKKEVQFDKTPALLDSDFPTSRKVLSKSAYFTKNRNAEVVPNQKVENLDRFPKLCEGDEKELLLGFIYISEAQFLNVSPNSFILCQPFCQNDTSASRVVYSSNNPLYNFCQTVPLLYEDDILLKLRENFMIIEFWEKQDQTDQLFGLTRLPLHQFYLAYRNAIILQHLKKNKLPVIGTDWWEPIYSTDTNELIGQIQVLTALGTEDQIRNLELERGFKDDVVKAKFPNSTQIHANAKTPRVSSYFKDRTKVVNKQQRIFYNKAVNTVKSSDNPDYPLKSAREPLKELKTRKIDVGVQSDIEVRMSGKEASQSVPQVQDMLGTFMKLLEQRPVRMENSTNTEPAVSSELSTQIPQSTESKPPHLRRTSDLLDSLQKALENKPIRNIPKLPSFKAQIIINGANQLPGRRKLKNKSKRNKGKSPKQEENTLPSTYVTFETMPGDPLQITSVFPKSTSPQWNYKCEVSLPMNLLTNGQKRLIFKVWKKCTNAVMQPNMLTDLVLGFAAVDLGVIVAGLPNIQGWFNIIDFSGKCNGQINIHVNPLENLSKTIDSSKCCLNALNSNTTLSQAKSDIDDCDELLSRALKRKFTELDEITQRLRLRLSEVVSDDSEGSNDEIAEEFEQDINNLCIEEDFDLINFEEEAKKLNVNHTHQKTDNRDVPKSSDLLSLMSDPGSSQLSIETEKETASAKNDVKMEEKLESDVGELLSDKVGGSNGTESSSSQSSFMEKHIMQGKQRIDTLLEKLSLINAEASQPFSSRYVSGCSVSNETVNAQDILKELDDHSRPNITAGTSYDPLMFQQLYAASMGGSSSNGGKLNTNSINNDSPRTDSSETSVITNLSDCRPNPDGQGTNSDDKGT